MKAGIRILVNPCLILPILRHRRRPDEAAAPPRGAMCVASEGRRNGEKGEATASAA